MIRMIFLFCLTTSIVFGDTINSTSKNPSMLVAGIQRAPSNIISQTCPYWSGDLNNAPGNAGTSNCLNGSGLGNAPSGDWYFVDTKYHVGGTHWATQTAVGMTISGAQNTYVRNKYNGSWSAWEKVGGSDSATKSANGQTILPSGLILKWGAIGLGDIASDTYGSLNFPSAFPTSALQVFVTLHSLNGGSFDAIVGTTSISKTGFSYTAQEWGGVTQNLTLRYFAIGY